MINLVYFVVTCLYYEKFNANINRSILYILSFIIPTLLQQKKNYCSIAQLSLLTAFYPISFHSSYTIITNSYLPCLSATMLSITTFNVLSKIQSRKIDMQIIGGLITAIITTITLFFFQISIVKSILYGGIIGLTNFYPTQNPSFQNFTPTLIFAILAANICGRQLK